MLRNILLLVEDTPSALVAKAVARDIAARGNCKLTALRINEAGWGADDDDFPRSPYMLIVEELAECRPNAAPPSNAESEPVFTDSDDRLSAANVIYHEQVLSGPKYAVLSRESAHNDLTIMGRDGNFVEDCRQDAKEVINLMLEYQPRPLIVTPPQSISGHDILMTYDGSPGASRAIQSFVLMGLVAGRAVHVLSVDRKKNLARSRVDTVATYLKNHHIGTMPHAIASRADMRDIVSDVIDETRSSLVVAGAFGSSSWRRSVFGSVSDYLIRYCPVPLFTCQ